MRRLFSGFNLWTSAHGFHHISLTTSTFWKVFWVILVAICTGCLIGCVIYYFYYIFSTAVYTRVTMENPSVRPWPVMVLCERQVSIRSIQFYLS